MKGLRNRIVEALLGPIEDAGDRLIRVQAQRGAGVHRARALRQIGARPTLEAEMLLMEGLQATIPGVRRAASWALGCRGEVRAQAALMGAAQLERCDPVRWTMAMAAVRCGAPVADAWSVVRAGAERTMSTWNGARSPAPVVGMGLAEASIWWCSSLSPDADDPAGLVPVPVAELRQQARARCEADTDDRQALLDLAVHQHPEDWALLRERLGHQGRRMRHVVTEALGLHGDPRSIPDLVRILEAVDVDPGHGFAGRARAAASLGRLGLPVVTRVLLRALENEAHDHEGRPGAGLGIQTPVRVALIAALGNIGAATAAAQVASYLGNTSGTSAGGFYLPSMDVLYKLHAVEAAQSLLHGPEIPAANALGVLRAIGADDLVAQWVDDPRPRVAAVARGE